MKITWSRRAVQHLTEIREHIGKDNPEAADRVVGTHELVSPDMPYIIPYRMKQGYLELLAIFHGRQKWPKHLRKRGRAVARLLPAGDRPVPIFGRMRGTIEIVGDISKT